MIPFAHRTPVNLPGALSTTLRLTGSSEVQGKFLTFWIDVRDMILIQLPLSETENISYTRDSASGL